MAQFLSNEQTFWKVIARSGDIKSNQIKSNPLGRRPTRFSFYGLACVASLIAMPKPKLTLGRALHANENGRPSSKKVAAAAQCKCKSKPRQLVSARRSTINPGRMDGRSKQAQRQRKAKQSNGQPPHLQLPVHYSGSRYGTYVLMTWGQEASPDRKSQVNEC